MTLQGRLMSRHSPDVPPPILAVCADLGSATTRAGWAGMCSPATRQCGGMSSEQETSATCPTACDGPNRVDTDLLASDRGRGHTRRELDISDDNFVVGWAASLHRFQGWTISSKIVARVDREDIILLLVGPGISPTRARPSLRAPNRRPHRFAADSPCLVPRLVNAMDGAVLLANRRYHYSQHRGAGAATG